MNYEASMDRVKELFEWQQQAREGRLPAKREEQKLVRFKESALAHRYLDGLKGIEIGGSKHNAFAIPGCINVDCERDNGHKAAEIALCGESLPVDVIAEGDNLPFPDDSWDYVINSHVIEHMPDPVKAIAEWMRVVRDGGYLFFSVPTRDMNPDDRRYAYSTIEQFDDANREGYTFETAPYQEGQGPRGHYWFFTPMRFAHFLGVFFGRSLEVVEMHEIDGKAGNGSDSLMRVHKKFLYPNPCKSTS